MPHQHLLLPLVLLVACDPSLSQDPSSNSTLRVVSDPETPTTIDRTAPSVDSFGPGLIRPSGILPESARTVPGTDTDGDGLYDAFELDHGLDPLNPDTDGDGIHDHWDLLGSEHTLQDPTNTGGFAWFDPSVTTFEAPDRPDAEQSNAPLTGLHLQTVGERSLVVFGPTTRRPVHSTCTPLAYGPPLCGHLDSRLEWGILAHAELRFEQGPFGFETVWELQLHDGTYIRQDHQRHQPQTAPTGTVPRPHWGPDPDADGLSAEEEFLLGTDPLLWDSDNDGIPDGIEHFYGQDPLDEDTDNDGLLDTLEYLANTDPADNDRDRDTLSDTEEERLGTSPNASDTDRDGLDDNLELIHGTNPLDWDTNNDSIPDGQWLFRRPQTWVLTEAWSTFSHYAPVVGHEHGWHVLIRDTPAGPQGAFIDDRYASLTPLVCTTRNKVITCQPDVPGSPSAGSIMRLVRTPTGVDLLFGYWSWPLSLPENVCPQVNGPIDDTDNDGLSNTEESLLGTDPRCADSDDDGLNDSTELVFQTDPLNADTNNDGTTDLDALLP